MRPREKISLVYILAASHSGSTLLSRLLARHPEVCTVGELKMTSLGDVARYRCSCGEAIDSCPFWRGVAEDLRAQGHCLDFRNPSGDYATGSGPMVRWLLRPLHRGPVLEAVRDLGLALAPGWRRHCASVQSFNAALARSVCSRLGARLIVDSSKTGVRLKFLLRNPALDVRVIRLVRDGRGVALTYTDPWAYADARDPALRGGGEGGSRDSQRLPFDRAVWEWRRSNEEADLLLRGLRRDRWLEVRYETLCRSVAGSLDGILRFLGLDPAGLAAVPAPGAQHIIGNGMRFDRDPDVVLDERWRSALTAEHLGRFETLAGALSRRLGYPS
ncbi:MAG: hypothetical protein KBA95_03865 [Acidobacteria bacterium]|nr:hypothetical protein [Acidobacteriota bacterium]